MRDPRNNRGRNGQQRRDDERNYSSSNAGYSDRYIYERDYEDYNDPYENRSYRRNTSEFDRGYGSNDQDRPHSRYSSPRSGPPVSQNFRQWNEGYDNNYGEGNTSGRYNREHDDDRNFFQRAGDRIRETWNEWTHRDVDRDRDGNERRQNFHSDRWSHDHDDHPYRHGERQSHYYRDEPGGGRIHWGGNSNYNRLQGNEYDDRRRRPRHDYSYGHSGSAGWNSEEYNDRYYNGQNSDRSSALRRGRELQEDYPY